MYTSICWYLHVLPVLHRPEVVDNDVKSYIEKHGICLKDYRIKLLSEIVWHRFFAVPAFIRDFRSYIAVRKFLVKASPNFSNRFCARASCW